LVCILCICQVAVFVEKALCKLRILGNPLPKNLALTLNESEPFANLPTAKKIKKS
jgi:hypothetical protein